MANGRFIGRALALILTATLVISMLATTPSARAEDFGWTYVDDMYQDTSLGVGAVLSDGKIFLGLGFEMSSSLVTNSVYLYDQEWETWYSVTDCPIGVMAACGASVGQKVYVFGGLDSAYAFVDRVLIYDADLNSWSDSALLPRPFTFLKCASLGDGRILLAGGEWGSDHALDACYIFDTGSEAFTAVDPLPEARANGAMAFVDGMAYYLGGWDADRGVSDKIFAYDSVQDEWTDAGRLPLAVAGMAAVGGSNGLIYIIGGSQGFHWEYKSLDLSLAWDPADGRTIEMPSLVAPVKYAVALETPNGRIMYAGGHDMYQGYYGIYELPMLDITAELTTASVPQGGSAWVEVDVDAMFDLTEPVHGTVYLVRDNVTYGGTQFTAPDGGTLRLEVPISEDMAIGEYQVVFDSVGVGSWDGDYFIASMPLTVTEAPSQDERIDDLEGQLDALQDELDSAREELKEATDAKLDAMIGYVILILVIVTLVVAVLVLVRKK